MVENGRCRSTAADIAIAASEDVFQYHSQKAWYFETKIAVTDVTELNTFVGFCANGHVNPVAVPDDGIGFSHLEDTTTIQFVSRKNGAGVSFDYVRFSWRKYIYTFADSTITTQSATAYNMPDNAVRLGFLFQPVGSAPGVTAVQYQLFLDGKSVGTQAATTVPDDLLMELKMMTESKGTVANDLYVDYVQTVQQR